MCMGSCNQGLCLYNRSSPRTSMANVHMLPKVCVQRSVLKTASSSLPTHSSSLPAHRRQSPSILLQELERQARAIHNAAAATAARGAEEAAAARRGAGGNQRRASQLQVRLQPDQAKKELGMRTTSLNVSEEGAKAVPCKAANRKALQ